MPMPSGSGGSKEKKLGTQTTTASVAANVGMAKLGSRAIESDRPDIGHELGADRDVSDEMDGAIVLKETKSVRLTGRPVYRKRK